MEARSASRNSARLFDPKKNGKFKVRVGDLTSRNRGKVLKSVAFNHKPSQTGSQRKTSITPAQSADDSYELQIEDKAGDEPMNYTYSGWGTSSDHTYILTIDQDQQSAQIDSLSSVYGFNMISAPWEQDPGKLKQQYSQIEAQAAQVSSSEKASSASEAEDVAMDSDGPDDNNPYDYRHYLQGLPGAQPESKVPSIASTPLLAPKVGSVSPMAPTRLNGTSPVVTPRPPLKKQSRPETAKRQAKVFKSSEKVVDSDASDDDNDGLLIIDSGPPPPSKKRRPNFSGKPRSLHVAAEAARSTRPNLPAEREAGSGYEEDDESDEPKEAPTSKDPGSTEELARQAHLDDEIDDFELPGPINTRPPPPARRQSMWEPGEQEELEAMLGAYDDDDANDQPPPPAASTSRNNAQESESESEEE